MFFPVSGVEVEPYVPVLVGFVIALLTTPAGVSGAFLLMPFQFSVLGFTTPGVTPTNLVFNVISTPGGILRFVKESDVDRNLILWILKGTVPGVIVGSALRVAVFHRPDAFKAFVGLVLLGLGANLLLQAKRNPAGKRPRSFDHSSISILGAGVGVIGGIYGISGGSILAPVLVGVFRLPVSRVAPATLAATLMTSIVAVASFELMDLLDVGPSSEGPDWVLAFLFGIGGAGGSNVAALFTGRIPEMWLRALLGCIAVAVGFNYL